VNIQFKSSACHTRLIIQNTGNVRKSKPPNDVSFGLSYVFPHRGCVEVHLVGDEDGVITADVEIEVGAACTIDKMGGAVCFRVGAMTIVVAVIISMSIVASI